MNAIVEHLRECDECRPGDGSTAALLTALGDESLRVDVPALSNRVLAASRPILSRRASRLWWQRVAFAAAVVHSYP